MSFALKTRKVDNVVLCDMSGRMVSGEPVLLLRETLRKYLNEGNRSFVFNLADVSFIDSSGLGELVASYSRVRSSGGSVKMLKLTARAKDLLQMTKLLTVFDTYEEEAQAVAAAKAGG